LRRSKLPNDEAVVPEEEANLNQYLEFQMMDKVHKPSD
jgi:hypothetical protein